MITGMNTRFQFDGVDFHVQCEDLGDALGCFELRVYREGEGRIIWQKRMDYQEEAAGLEGAERIAALRKMMAKLVKTVQAAIKQGKIS